MRRTRSPIFAILIILMLVAFAVPAYAEQVIEWNGQEITFSDYDIQNLDSDQLSAIADDKAAIAEMESNPNGYSQEEWDDRHDHAEAIRSDAASGQGYSGGWDGSEYHPYGGDDYDYDYDYDYTPPTPSYTFTATAGIGGTVSPSGTFSVTQEQSTTITVTPNDGFAISAVYVDETDMGPISSYTFDNVTTAHTIRAEFKSAAYIHFDPTDGISLGDGGANTLDGLTTKSGYGFTANVEADMAFVSNVSVKASYCFTASSETSLESNGSLWQFPTNAASPTSARKVYIPVETPNDVYGITFTIRARDDSASLIAGYDVYIEQTNTVYITVNGSMYDDYYTGDQY